MVGMGSRGGLDLSEGLTLVVRQHDADEAARRLHHVLHREGLELHNQATLTTPPTMRLSEAENSNLVTHTLQGRIQMNVTAEEYVHLT